MIHIACGSSYSGGNTGDLFEHIANSCCGGDFGARWFIFANRKNNLRKSWCKSVLPQVVWCFVRFSLAKVVYCRMNYSTQCVTSEKSALVRPYRSTPHALSPNIESSTILSLPRAPALALQHRPVAGRDTRDGSAGLPYARSAAPRWGRNAAGIPGYQLLVTGGGGGGGLITGNYSCNFMGQLQEVVNHSGRPLAARRGAFRTRRKGTNHLAHAPPGCTAALCMCSEHAKGGSS